MASRDVWSSLRKTSKQAYEETEDRILRDRFEDPINFDWFYKNFDESVKYRGWFYDDSSERKDLERKFLQPHPDESIRQGEYIHWADSIWICMGVDTQYKNKQQGMIYQCLENTMNWVDENGYHSFPFYSQAKVLRDPLSDGRAISLVEDTMEAYLQKNNETITIRENLRFAFGVDTVFKVIQRIDYAIDNTIKVVMKKDERRDGDDFANGIAMNTNIVVVIEPTIVNGSIGGYQQLIGSVILDGIERDDKTLTWSSSDISIASVNSTGLVFFNSNGTCDIIGSYNGITSSVSAICTSTPIVSTEYIIEPLLEKIVMDEDETFTVNKYVDGVIVGDVFTITDKTNGTGYTFSQLDGNTFSISNTTSSNLSLVLEITNGVYTFEKIYKLRTW